MIVLSVVKVDRNIPLFIRTLLQYYDQFSGQNMPFNIVDNFEHEIIFAGGLFTRNLTTQQANKPFFFLSFLHEYTIM
jgi:hypothetical protein